MKVKYFVISCAIVCFLFGGCQDSRSYEKSLQDVAKNWCLTIRASQIIPVYPLTEDLQVGDVFLVSQPVDRQHLQYTQKGFLPLTRHLDRIDPGDFSRFYKLSFADPDDAPLTLPKDWFMTGDPEDMSRAPGMSFPEYSFAITDSGGVNLAIPVQGVPIGLSLLNARQATGRVTIKNAKTYGLDLVTLYPKILKWEKQHHDLLVHYAADPKKEEAQRYHYIRVISRVCLTGEIAVSLDSSKTGSGGISAGAPKPVELLTPVKAQEDKEAEAITNYTNSIDILNEMLSKSLTEESTGVLPGGTVKVLTASANSISMKETFARPHVVGYLGFDMAIDEFGYLGPPIPTMAVLEGEAVPEIPPTLTLVNLKRAYDIVRKNGGSRGEKLIQSTEKAIRGFLPEAYPVPIYNEDMSVLVEQGKPFNPDRLIAEFSIYLIRLHDSRAALENAGGLSDAQKEQLAKTDDELVQAEIFQRQNRNLLNAFLNYADALSEF